MAIHMVKIAVFFLYILISTLEKYSTLLMALLLIKCKDKCSDWLGGAYSSDVIDLVHCLNHIQHHQFSKQTYLVGN